MARQERRTETWAVAVRRGQAGTVGGDVSPHRPLCGGRRGLTPGLRDLPACSPLHGIRRAWSAFLGNAARPLRFALTGGLAACVQLTLLVLLTHAGWREIPANGLAFLLAAQVNFALSSTFTWRDRQAGRALARRWLVFHGSVAGMAAINMAVFALVRGAMPVLAASALGIGVAATGNYITGDRLVFRHSTPGRQMAREVA